MNIFLIKPREALHFAGLCINKVIARTFTKMKYDYLAGYNPELDIIIKYADYNKLWNIRKLIEIKKGIWTFDYKLIFHCRDSQHNNFSVYENIFDNKRIYFMR